MIAADTNVLVRAIVGDEPRQAAAARAWMTANEHRGVLVDHVVLVEFVWVLRSRYRLPREEIVRVLALVLSTGGIVVPEEHLVRGALEDYRAGRGDFADHLIRHRAKAFGAAPMGTFDESLLKLSGFKRIG